MIPKPDHVVALVVLVALVYRSRMQDQRGDIERLRETYPAWAIGSLWTSAASGPDHRKLWATRGSVTVEAWTTAGLSERIAYEERANDWSAHQPRPFGG